MALNIENDEEERPAAEQNDERLLRFLEREVWSRVPEGSRAPDKAERETILGYDENGV